MVDIWDEEVPKKTSIMKKMEEELNVKFVPLSVSNEPIPEITDDDIEESNIEINTVVKEEKKKIHIDTVFDESSIADIYKKNNKPIVSFSLTDKLFYKGNEIPHCPAKIKAYLDGKQERPTEPMKAGNFFETLLLGGGRDGQQTLQLDRKQVSQKAKNDAIKAGLPEPEPEMRIDEIRIRHQVDKSKIIFFNHKIQVVPDVNTQVLIYKKIGDDILIQGHIDLFPTPIVWNGEEKVAIIDTKLTGNLSSSFGKYCWGTPEFIDFTQALFYFELVDGIDYSINPHLVKMFGKEMQFDNVIFLYYVADYKVSEDKLQCTFFEVSKTPDRMVELKETIRKTAYALDMYRKQDYPANPVFELCKNCILNYKSNGNCKVACNAQII